MKGDSIFSTNQSGKTYEEIRRSLHPLCSIFDRMDEDKKAKEAAAEIATKAAEEAKKAKESTDSAAKTAVSGTDYWVFNEEDGLTYLGNDGVDNGLKIAKTSSKIAKSLKNAIKNIRKDKALGSDKNLIKNSFKDLEVQSKEEQNAVINDLLNSQKTSEYKKEYGCLMLLKFIEDKAVVRFGEKIEGNDGEVTFHCYGSRGNLRDKPKNGNYVLGTIHTHSHDNGLSGWQPDDIKGAGDMSSVQTTGIPWYTIGPSKIHIGIPGLNSAFGTLLLANTNLLLDALNRAKEL
jgi:hypothetical protein